jgi:hypothetical protein
MQTSGSAHPIRRPAFEVHDREYSDAVGVCGIKDAVWKTAKQSATNHSTNLDAGIGIPDDSVNIMFYIVEKDRAESRALAVVIERSIVQFPLGESMKRDTRHLSKFRSRTPEHSFYTSWSIR